MSRGFYKRMDEKTKKPFKTDVNPTKRLTQMPWKNPWARTSAFVFLILDLLKSFASAKQQRNAPNTCKTYNSVDNAGEQRGLSAADPSNNVKLKQSDAAPVERADNGKDQRNTIQNHDCDHIPFFGSCLKRRASLAAKHSVKDSMHETWAKYARAFEKRNGRK